MYNLPYYKEQDNEEVLQFMKKYPFVFVWSGPSKSETALLALQYYKSKNIKSTGLVFRKVKASVGL